MIENTIETIKEAELKAEQKVKEASENGKALIDEAKKKAESVKNGAAKEMKEKAAQLNDILTSRGGTWMEESVKEAEEEIKTLKEKAAQKTDETVEKVISKLV